MSHIHNYHQALDDLVLSFHMQHMTLMSNHSLNKELRKIPTYNTINKDIHDILLVCKRKQIEIHIVLVVLHATSHKS